MAMTNETMAPPVIPNPGSDKEKALTKEQILKAAATIQSAQAQAKVDSEAELLNDTTKQFNDQVAQEERNAALLLKQQESQGSSKAIKDLTEDDAYNFEVAIVAKGAMSPDFLRVTLTDPNYVARWCNRNSIRQARLVAQGFRPVAKEDVSNLETLEMFLDSQNHFVYSDLVAMKILKNIYYAGLRKAYLDSLRATNNKKAAEAGAAFATTQLKGDLSGQERSYLAQQEAAGITKPIYNPTIGV